MPRVRPQSVVVASVWSLWDGDRGAEAGPPLTRFPPRGRSLRGPRVSMIDLHVPMIELHVPMIDLHVPMTSLRVSIIGWRSPP